MFEAFAQTRLDIVAFAERFAETVDDGAFQSCRQVRRRLWRFRIVPGGQLFRARRAQQSFEIILTRAALEIYQLRDAESSQSCAAFRGHRPQQRKYLLETP